MILENYRPEDLKKIKKLYRSAFPLNERTPFYLFKKRTRQGHGETLSIVEDGKWAGFAYLISNENLAYLFYLAIEDSMRGRGIGTQVIAALNERYSGKRLFLALEPLDNTAPNNAERIARHRFYEVAGLHDLPNRVKEGVMIYSIMGNGERILPDEYAKLVQPWFGFVWGKIIKTEIIEE